MKLTMHRYLFAVLLAANPGLLGADLLAGAEFHQNVIEAKAEKAARRGYIEYGTAPRYGWLTSKGMDYLEKAT